VVHLQAVIREFYGESCEVVGVGIYITSQGKYRIVSGIEDFLFEGSPDQRPGIYLRIVHIPPNRNIQFNVSVLVF